MEAEKPKKGRGVREFLREYLIIVVGVLTALAANEAVGSLHEIGLRREAREAIRGELGQDLDSFRRRAGVQDCVDRRLVEVEALLTATPPGAALPRPLWIGRPQVWNMTDSRWTAATSGARTALLTTREQAAYAEVYAGVRAFEEAERVEQLAWARLRSLETLPTLDADSRSRLIEALHEARYANFRIRVAAAQARDRAAAIGIRTLRAPFPEGSRSVCVAMNTPRDEALKLASSGGAVIAEP